MIISSSTLSKNAEIQQKDVVLVGGCFDILHAGHIEFLKQARKFGKVVILLESDTNIRKIKGDGRPVNNQNDRAIVLDNLKSVDYVISLNEMTKDEDYDKLIVQIKPAYIALTAGDPNIKKRKEQCEMVGAKLLTITKIPGKSTSALINKI